MSEIEGFETRFRGNNKTADLLTELPDDLRQKILERLSLKEAIRTSILSTHWKHEWTKLPKISLDELLFPVFLERTQPSSDSLTEYINVVNRLLLCLVGPLSKFALYIPDGFMNDQDLCQWLTILHRKSVRKLTLYCEYPTMKILPSVVFSYTDLTHLTLHWLKFPILPPSFSGFPCLISLKLFGCDLKTGSPIEGFIRSCPQLLNLQLYSFPIDILTLTIHGPKLEHLIVSGRFHSLCLGNETTKIRTLCVDLSTVDRTILVSSSLPRLQSLCLGPNFFATINHWRLSDHAFGRLKPQTLELVDVALHCPGIIYFAIKLLNSFQLLQRLNCKVSEYDLCLDTNPPPGLNCPNMELGNLPSLKYVETVCALGSSVELQFLKSILGCSPVLEVLTVKLSDKVKEDKDKLNRAMNLMQYPRASTKAQIIFKT